MLVKASPGLLREDKELTLPFEYNTRDGFVFGNETVMKYQIRDGSGLCICTTYYEEVAKKICEMFTNYTFEEYEETRKLQNKEGKTDEE